ncbi:WD repeat-containing protein 37 [Taenia crassiceps]|uniref:WD repeat-containing protein 37 n=1 Tax=Taenia crassiceps TaxID=6207 RepID=A0ABR4QT51_9CEST
MLHDKIRAPMPSKVYASSFAFPISVAGWFWTSGTVPLASLWIYIIRKPLEWFLFGIWIRTTWFWCLLHINNQSVTTAMTSIGTGVSSVCAASQTDGDSPVITAPDISESTLPREFRSRLHKMFERVEREFEREYQKLCAENYALQEKLEKFEDAEHPESSIFTRKLTASQLSHRIKQQYKQSTSRLVSSLRPASGGLALPSPGCNPDSSRCGSWKFVHRFTGHRDGVWEATCFHSLIATASADTTVRLWNNSEKHNCLLIYSGHSGSVNSVRFRDRDNLMLTCSGDGTAHLIALPSALFDAVAPTHSIHGASGDLDNGHQSEGINTGTEADSQAEGVQPPVQLRNPSAVFQSASLFVAEAGVVGVMPSGLLTCDSASSLDSYPLAAADFVCGREQLVTASWDRLGHLYDLNTGQEVQSLAGHDRELTDVRCCWDSNLPVVVTSARDSTFRVWDFRQPRLEVHVQQAHSRTVSTAQFLPGSGPDQIVSAGTDRCCRLWDLRSLRSPIFTVRTDASINRLAISRAGLLQYRQAVAGSGFAAQSGGEGWIAGGSVSAAPMGMTVVGGTGGNTIASTMSADAIAHSCVLALPLDNRTLRLLASNGSRIGRIPRNIAHGHTSAITSAAWAPEGQCNLFTTGFDQQLLGWQLQIS